MIRQRWKIIDNIKKIKTFKNNSIYIALLMLRGVDVGRLLLHLQPIQVCLLRLKGENGFQRSYLLFFRVKVT